MASIIPSIIAALPRPLSIGAITTGLAYVNARFGVSHDLWFTYISIWFAQACKTAELNDRVNTFYVFEEHARNPQVANRPFLATPQDAENPSRSHPSWTYAEAYDIVLKYADWLRTEHGVQKDDIVALNFTNRPEFVWLWFALWSLGAKPAFINCNLRGKAFAHCVRISDASLLLLDPRLPSSGMTADLAQGQDASSKAAKVVVVDDVTSQQIITTGSPYRAPDAARSGVHVLTPAVLIYTSGTTGLPKAANVNWGKFLSSAHFWCHALGMKREDRFFTAMPLYHSSAAVLGVSMVLGPGACIIVGPAFSARAYMKQLTETRATIMQYVGEMCRYLLHSPASQWDRAHSIRLAFGNGMRPDVWQRFKDRFGINDILEFYGATEAPKISLVYERNGFLRGAVGRSGLFAKALMGQQTVLLKYDVKADQPIRDSKTGFCVKAAVNEPGEVVYVLDAETAEMLLRIYHGNDKASSAKVLRHVFKDGDAYYRTGDLQRIDAEGRWWFMDRIGDTFRWKSENVSTAEVSQAVGHHPAIREANAYGVELPHHDGRAGCAAVGLAEGVTFDEKVRKSLAAEVRRSLPRYAIPIFLRVPVQLDVTGTMKHQKVDLRSQGVDPSKTGKDLIYWLPPGAESYQPFGQDAWQKLAAGQVKL